MNKQQIMEIVRFYISTSQNKFTMMVNINDLSQVILFLYGGEVEITILDLQVNHLNNDMKFLTIIFK